MKVDGIPGQLATSPHAKKLDAIQRKFARFGIGVGAQLPLRRFKDGGQRLPVLDVDQPPWAEAATSMRSASYSMTPR